MFLKKFMGLVWVRTKTSSITDGRPMVTYEEQSGHQNPFRIICTPGGIRFVGVMSKELSTQADLQDFAELTSMAWKDHKQIVPKIEVAFKGPTQ